MPAGKTTKGRKVALPPSTSCPGAAGGSRPATPPSSCCVYLKSLILILLKPKDSAYPQAREMSYEELVFQVIWPCQHSASVH